MTTWELLIFLAGYICAGAVLLMLVVYASILINNSRLHIPKPERRPRPDDDTLA